MYIGDFKHTHTRRDVHTHTHTHSHTQVGDRSLMDRGDGRELSLSLYDKFSAKLLEG